MLDKVSSLLSTIMPTSKESTTVEKPDPTPRRLSIGLDLGGANIRFATAYEGSDGHAVIDLLNGGKPIPAMFCVNNGKRQFGKWALNTPQPNNVIFDANIVLPNTDLLSANDSASNDYLFWPAKRDANGKYNVSGGLNVNRGEKFAQPEVIAAFIAHVRDCVMEEELKKSSRPVEIASLSIVVPSFCGQNHRRIILQATKIAGFSGQTTSVQLINQSTAIATAVKYGYFQCLSSEGDAFENVLILSIGADSVECSVFVFENNQMPRLLVSNGLVGFGGNKFTECLVAKTLYVLKRELVSAELLKNIWFSCEKTKKELSEQKESEIHFALKDGEKIKYNRNIEQFKNVVAKQIEQLRDLVSGVVNHSSVDRIDRVVLAGGASRLPFVREILNSLSIDSDKIIDRCSIVPEEAAVRGAALNAARSLYSPREIPSCFRNFALPEYAFSPLTMKNGGIELELIPSAAPLPLKREVLVWPNARLTLKENKSTVIYVNGTPQAKKVKCEILEKDGILVVESIAVPETWGLLSEAAERTAIERQKACYRDRERKGKAEVEAEKRRLQEQTETFRQKPAEVEAEKRRKRQEEEESKKKEHKKHQKREEDVEFLCKKGKEEQITNEKQYTQQEQKKQLHNGGSSSLSLFNKKGQSLVEVKVEPSGTVNENESNGKGHAEHPGEQHQYQQAHRSDCESSVKVFENVITHLNADLPQFNRIIQELYKTNANCPMFNCFLNERERLHNIATKLSSTKTPELSPQQTQDLVVELKCGTIEIVKLAEALVYSAQITSAVKDIYHFVCSKNPYSFPSKEQWTKKLELHAEIFGSQMIKEQPFPTKDHLLSVFVEFCNCVQRDYLSYIEENDPDSEIIKLVSKRKISDWPDRYQ